VEDDFIGFLCPTIYSMGFKLSKNWLVFDFAEIVFLAEWWSGSKVILYADPEIVKTYFGKEHAQLLLNHCYEVDWLLGWLICDRVKILGVRIFSSLS